MYRCEKCGAYLDAGEKCDCNHKPKVTAPPKANKIKYIKNPNQLGMSVK